MTHKMDFTDSEACINMESIQVVSSLRRAPPENVSRSLQLISCKTSHIFEKRDSDIENTSQAFPKETSGYLLELSSPVRNISDEAASIQSTLKSEHPSCQLRSSPVSGNSHVKAKPNGGVPHAPSNRRDRGNRTKDSNYAYFKTRSGKVERQLSRLLSTPQARDNEVVQPDEPEVESLSARHFFDALQGPELEIVRVVRLNFFRGFRFSIAWWAYTFPLSSAAVATIKYSNEVRHPFTQSLAVALSIISSFTVFSLLLITISKALVPGALFPNDASIAIVDKTEFEKSQEFCRRQEGSDAV